MEEWIAMALTQEQEQALDQLLACIHPSQAQIKPDLLKAWLGISGGDIKTALLSLLSQKDSYERSLLDWVEKNPLDATLEFLGVTAWAFYQAEKGQNPKIKTYIDALYYITTCASVGYADIFAATQPGRAIASLVMTIGPAITNAALTRPKVRAA